MKIRFEFLPTEIASTETCIVDADRIEQINGWIIALKSKEVVFAAKKKVDKVCLWCGGKLKNDNESFCSVYCVGMWGGEGD